MNKKQRTILAGRRPKCRYSHVRDEGVSVYGISPLVGYYTEWVKFDALFESVLCSFGIPAHLFRGECGVKTTD